MFYKTKDFHHLVGIKGFSSELIKNHLGLYEGYIKNANHLLEMLTQILTEGKTGTPQFAEIKRRLAFEINGVKLHEYYFENMTKENGEELDKDSELARKIHDEFGSFVNWKKSFRGVGAMRGVGWAIAVYDPTADLVINTWVEEHHIGHIAGTFPILVMDLWEHAMLLDYGSDRQKYMDAFFHVIDWGVVARRFEGAMNLQRV